MFSHPNLESNQIVRLLTQEAFLSDWKKIPKGGEMNIDTFIGVAAGLVIGVVAAMINPMVAILAAIGFSTFLVAIMVTRKDFANIDGSFAILFATVITAAITMVAV